MAHLTIMTAGSRGDVQPYIALGLGLQARGHTVRLATHALFAEWIQSCGLEFHPVAGDPLAMAHGQAGRNWIETGQRGREFVRGFRDFMEPLLPQITADLLAACRDTDAILFSGIAFFVAYNVAEKLDLPFVQTYLHPINPTRDFPSMVFPTRRRGGSLFNLSTHVVGGQAFWQMTRPLVNRIRREMLGLRPLSLLGPFLSLQRNRLPVIHGYSPTLLPAARDWNKAMSVSGFWFMDDESVTPPAALVDFLNDGPPPVYIGFGSMTGNNPEQVSAVVLAALARTRQRGVVLGGWAGLAGGDLPDTVFRVNSISHNWLFPRMAALVHHGGTGTTHTGLRSGVANVVVPFFADQPFWAERVHRLGAGPAPVPQAELTVERLAAALETALTDQAMRERAAAVGRQIRAETGVATAVDIIDRYIAQRPRFFDGLKL